MKLALLFHLFAVITCVSVAACAASANTPPPDGAGTTSKKAAAVCAHLRELHCPEGETTHGETCETFIAESNLSGLISIDCILHAPNREVLHDCNVRCRQ